MRTCSSLLLVCLLCPGCEPDDHGLTSIPATVAEMRGGYLLAVEADGEQAKARSIFVSLEASRARFIDHNQCPSWDHQTVTVNDVVMMQRVQGGALFGLTGSSGGACQQAIFELAIDDLARWQAFEQVVVKITDETGSSAFTFENFVRTPVITVLDPPDGHVVRGQTFVLKFDPSVDLLPAFALFGGLSSTTLPLRWGAFEMSTVALDHTRVALQVPADALLGHNTLHFSTGIHPEGLGFRGGVLACEDAMACTVRRVIGGGLSLPQESLDDEWVTFTLDVGE